MTDNTGESVAMTKTFRFASGEVLTLHEDQIEKIPYLAAIVSSADHFESPRDEDGHYKLNPDIKHDHFSFALESLSFESIQQIFTRLPKQNDIIPIIALLDFLGIGSQPDPTLKEVDITFFYNLVYSPLLEKYIQIIQPSIIRDMAVRFANAMAKEEYDFTKCKIVDQIYWFIMFILSAHKFFGPRLRYHVYKIAEHCFSLFKPSLLRPLKSLIKRTNMNTRKLNVMINLKNFDDNEENNRPLEHILDLDESYRFSWSDSNPSLEQRQNLLLHRTYSNYSHFLSFGRQRTVSEESLLTPVHKRVSEIMYARLQSEICRRAMVLIHETQSPFTFVQEEYIFLILSSDLKLEDLPKTINDIFELEVVQAEIRERILEEICVLIPKLEKKHAGLVKEIQEYDQDQETPHVHLFNWHDLWLGTSHFERIQEEALCYELTLEKLYQGSDVIEQLLQNVLDALYYAAQKQFSQWKTTRRDIDKLDHQLSGKQLVQYLSITAKEMRERYWIPVTKPIPKLQLKHSVR